MPTKWRQHLETTITHLALSQTNIIKCLSVRCFFAFWLCSQTCQMGIHVFAYRNVLHRHILVSDFGVHLNTVPEASLFSRSTTCAGGTCDATKSVKDIVVTWSLLLRFTIFPVLTFKFRNKLVRFFLLWTRLSYIYLFIYLFIYLLKFINHKQKNLNAMPRQCGGGGGIPGVCFI